MAYPVSAGLMRCYVPMRTACVQPASLYNVLRFVLAWSGGRTYLSTTHFFRALPPATVSPLLHPILCIFLADYIFQRAPHSNAIHAQVYNVKVDVLCGNKRGYRNDGVCTDKDKGKPRVDIYMYVQLGHCKEIHKM